MKKTNLTLLQLLEHVESCAKSIKSSHNLMSRNTAIIMFIEETAFVEVCMSLLYQQWYKQLPLYEDKGVDYNHWINKLEMMTTSYTDLEKYAFSYLKYKYGVTNLRNKDIVKLYTEEIYTKNGVNPLILPVIETLQATQIPLQVCSNALKPIKEILKKINNLLDNPSLDQYEELGHRILTDYLAEQGGIKNHELKRNTPPGEFISKMDSEIKRLHEYYLAKGISPSWLNKMSKATLSFDPCVVGQIVFSMRTRWKTDESKQFIEDYSYIVLMNNHKRKLLGDLNKYKMPQEHPDYALTFDQDKLLKLLSEKILRDLFFDKLREVCGSINEFKCKDYEFVFIMYTLLVKEGILKHSTSKNGFFNAFSPNKFSGELDTWRSYGRKISHTYNDYSQKKLSPIVSKSNKKSKYSEPNILYESFGRLKQKLPRMTDVEDI